MRLCRSPATFVLVALAALLLVYQNSLHNSFHYDDFHSIVENPHVRQLSNIPAFFVSPQMFSGMAERAMYRPVLLVTYALNHGFGGYEVRGYHLFNLALHAGCTLFVFLLGRALGWASASACVGALLFALHPAQTEVVNYISSRSESLAAFWYLAALLAYLRWRREGSGRVYLVVSLTAFALGLLSKSIVVTLPAALLLYELLQRPGSARLYGWRDRWPHHLLYWAMAGAYLLLTRGWVHAALDRPVRSVGVHLLTQIKAAVYYVQLAALPVRLSVEHPFETSHSPLDPAVLAGLLALCSGAAALGALAVRGARSATLLVGWAALAMMPASLVPLNVLVNEHRLYLPLALASPGLGALCLAAGSKRAGVWLGGALLAVFAVLSHQRNPTWEDELTLWRDAVNKAPGMYRAHMHLGGALEQEGRIADALESFAKAAGLAPEVVEVHYNRGNALRQVGRVEEAMAAYQRSLQLNPAFAPSVLNLAALYRDSGRPEACERLLLRSRAELPESAEVLRRLGVLYGEQRRLAEAEAALRRAVELRPDLAAAHYSLANLHLERGDRAAAVRHYARAIALQSDHVEARNNLGLLYLRQGAYERSAVVFADGLRRTPEASILYYGLGRAQAGMGERHAAIASYRRFLQGGGVDPQVAVTVRERIRALRQEDLEDPE